MRKFSLQTLIVFALGLTCGFFVNCSFWPLLALLIALVSVFIYTMRDAQGLKHTQAAQFIAISTILYLVALLISFYAVIALIPFALYELFNKKTLKAMTLRLLPIYIITLIVLIINKDTLFVSNDF
ncbi:MAG: hypothetical protein LBL16_04065 [Endomicrobium sp.]|jgi:hypothetical protein|nr:hypothetical protein [Endomicrobium sp.]